MITMSKENLIKYLDICEEDCDIIHGATNWEGKPYRRLIVPMTEKDYEAYGKKGKISEAKLYIIWQMPNFKVL